MPNTSDVMFPFCPACNDYHYPGTACIQNTSIAHCETKHVFGWGDKDKVENYRVIAGQLYRVLPGSPPMENDV